VGKHLTWGVLIQQVDGVNYQLPREHLDILMQINNTLETNQ
jgi:hypothetical protein